MKELHEQAPLEPISDASRQKGFDPERVEKTLQALIEHHDALRMVYREENGNILQAYKAISESKVSFEIVDLYGSDENMLKSQIKILANRLQSSLDLQNGPLLKAEQYRTEAGDHLLIAVHHLVVDGVSWRILLEDFASGYMQAEKEGNIVFPQKQIPSRIGRKNWRHSANQRIFTAG